MPLKLIKAVRKAVATFLFAGLGVVVGSSLFDAGWPVWQQALSVGAGALVNLLYRWSEGVINEKLPNEEPMGLFRGVRELRRQE